MRRRPDHGGQADVPVLVAGARRRDRVQGTAQLERRLQVDPLGQHRGAVDAECVVVRRVRPA
jgi:hypothetical protein